MTNKNYWIPVGYILTLSLYFSLFFVIGCGTADKIYHIGDPRDIDKEELANQEPNLITPTYGFKVVVHDTEGQSLEWWGEQIDEQFLEYANDMNDHFPGFNINTDLLKSVKIVVVGPSKFECDYHAGRCSGEYDSGIGEHGVIFVSAKDFGKDGFAPLLKHEWSHVNGLLNSDHSNHDDVKRVTDGY